MTTAFLVYFIILSLLAEILGTVGGFGSSMYFVPIAGFFIDFQSVLGVTALFHLASNISKIALFRSGFDKKLIVYMGIPAVAFVILGAYLTQFFNNKLLEIALGIFLIVLSLLLLVLKKAIQPTTFNTIGGGALSGITAGLLGTGGAVRGLVLGAFSLPKEIFIATSAIIDLGIDLSRSVVYISNGYVHAHDLYLVAILIVVSFIGTYFGKKILDRFTQEQFKKVMLFLILIIGCVTLIHQLY